MVVVAGKKAEAFRCDGLTYSVVAAPMYVHTAKGEDMHYTVYGTRLVRRGRGAQSEQCAQVQVVR